MTVLQLGNIAVQRIVEHEVPVYLPSDMFDEATPEAIEPYREWLEPKALCPRTGRLVMPFPAGTSIAPFLIRDDCAISYEPFNRSL